MTEEATGRGSIALTSVMIKHNGGARRNSTGKLATKASISVDNSEGKNLPHYLKASTGSCHDLCKYGMGHSFEANGESIFLHRSSSKKTTSDNKRNGLKILNLGQRRKKSVIKPIVSSDLLHPKHELIDGEQRTVSTGKKSGSTETVKQETHVWEVEPSEEPDIIKQDTSHVKLNRFSVESENTGQMTSPVRTKELPEHSETKEQMVSLTTKTIEQSQEIVASERMNPSPSLVECNNSLEEYITVAQAIPSFVDIECYDEPEVIKRGNSEAGKSDTFDQTTTAVEKKQASEDHKTIKQPTRPVFILSGEQEVIKQKIPAVKKILAYTETKVKQKVSSLVSKRFDFSPKSTAKRRTSDSKSQTPSVNSRGLTGRISRENMSVKSTDFSKIRGKISKSPRVPLRPMPSINQGSNLKPRKCGKGKSAAVVTDQNQYGKAESSINESKEKTIVVVEPKPEMVPNSPSVVSSSLSLSSFPSTSYCEEQEHKEFDSTSTKGSDLIYEQEAIGKNQVSRNKERPRVAMVQPNDTDQIPYKLKFRRGKEVSLRSEENNSPKTLKFRLGRVVGRNQSFKEVGRSFRRKIESLDGDPSSPNVRAPAIVLRRQFTPRKKTTQSLLFNYVIQETANKLVESRKSKVKALVGAFETIISLQGSNPVAKVLR